MKVVFFGTPLFAAQVLEYLLEHQVQIVAVITKPDKPKGRFSHLVPTPVKEVAIAHDIPFYQPELVSAPEFAEVLQAYQADLFVVVAYGEIIKQHLLEMPKIACINLHASLLPKYRGAAPIQRSIVSGEQETGVTIMHMAKKMDAGDMIHIVKVPIGPDTTYSELEKELCKAGSEALLKIIRDSEQGVLPRTPQDHTQATFAPKIELEDCEIHWNQPAATLHNLVRGVSPFPGAWCWVEVRGQKLRLKIFKSQLMNASENVPGKIIGYGKGGIVVSCGTGALRLLEVQLEGKKLMNSEELARGIAQEQINFLSAHSL